MAGQTDMTMAHWMVDMTTMADQMVGMTLMAGLRELTMAHLKATKKVGGRVLSFVVYLEAMMASKMEHKTATTMADQMVSMTSMAGQTEVTMVHWMVLKLLCWMVRSLAVYLVATMAQ